ncbi:MAG: hypothetical protein ACYC6Y_27925 [Thermoguttaceae bacterium]
MHTTFHSMFGVVALAVWGCPLGTPKDHYRPPGHQDTTIVISRTDDGRFVLSWDLPNTLDTEFCVTALATRIMGTNTPVISSRAA